MNIDLKTIKTLYHSKNIIKPQTKQSHTQKKKKKNLQKTKHSGFNHPSITCSKRKRIIWDISNLQEHDQPNWYQLHGSLFPFWPNIEYNK